MALFIRRDDIKQVPWLSLAEWYHVYEQIYSSNLLNQRTAYETMLAWKVRMPKLPVGVDCTLSILQICLRDREWTSKMDSGELSLDYERDLCLMYSTVIMRFLNHIGNIGVTKQTSLFSIAKQLQIPDWIVNLRHDTAHGHELPSLSILRVAANFLLSWLHEEYWIAEARALEESCMNEAKKMETDDVKETEAFKDLLELWAATGLYIHAGYRDISGVSDTRLKSTLEDLRVYAQNLTNQTSMDDSYVSLNVTDCIDDADTSKILSYTSSPSKYDLRTARDILLAEIKRYFGKNFSPYKENIILNSLLTSASFFPKEEMLLLFSEEKNIDALWTANYLPADLLKFWQDILRLLHKKKVLAQLVVMLIEMSCKEAVNKQKRLLAALWASSILYAYVKLSVAKNMLPVLERNLWNLKKKLSLKILNVKLKEEVNSVRPELSGTTWLGTSGGVPLLFKSAKFLREILLDVNEFTIKFILPLLELSTADLGEKKHKKLVGLIKIYLLSDYEHNKTSNNRKLYTMEDVQKIQSKQCFSQQSDEGIEKNDCTNNKIKKDTPSKMTNEATQDTRWKIAFKGENWTTSPIGLLPWQLESLESLKALEPIVLNADATPEQTGIVPGVISIDDLGAKNSINWNTVLKKRKQPKRKQVVSDSHMIIDRAIQAAKKRK